MDHSLCLDVLPTPTPNTHPARLPISVACLFLLSLKSQLKHHLFQGPSPNYPIHWNMTFLNSASRTLYKIPRGLSFTAWVIV